MKTPKISVIVPLFNSELFLKKCVDSILAQTFMDFECILVNDGSTDTSPEICNRYEKQDKRIKVIHKKNEGLPLARKTGLENSSGEYIQFVDSDDWIEADMFERMYKKALSENFDIVYCIHSYTIEGKILPATIYDSRGKEKQDIINDLITDKFYGMVWFKLFKRILFNDLIFPVFQFLEDRVINMQLFLNADKIGFEYSLLYHQLKVATSLYNSPARRKINGDEAYGNMELLNTIMMKRPDYDQYKTLMSQELKRMKKVKIQSYFPVLSVIKNIIKAFMPYGLFQLYRKGKNAFATGIIC